MISKTDARLGGGRLTKDERDDNCLNVLGAGFVGVSREIGDVQAQGGVVPQDPVKIYKRDSG